LRRRKRLADEGKKKSDNKKEKKYKKWRRRSRGSNGCMMRPSKQLKTSWKYIWTQMFLYRMFTIAHEIANFKKKM
jgi:hypothetical protein